MVKICVICGNDESSGLSECSEKSFQRMKEFACSWDKLGRYIELNGKLKSITWSSQQIFRHSKCYSALTHSNNLNKFKKNLENRLKNSDTEKSHDLSLCFVCQHAGNGKVSTVSTAKVAQEILNLKAKGSGAKHGLEAFTDVSAILNNQIKYHSSCLTTEKRKILTEAPIKTENEYESVNIQFLKFVKHQLTSLDENSPSIDMKEVEEKYKTFLEAAQLPLPVATIRRYLKLLFESDEELMSKVSFYQFEPCKPTVIANKSMVCKLVCENHFQKERMNENEVMKTVNTIRKDLSSIKEWEFNGSVTNR